MKQKNERKKSTNKHINKKSPERGRPTRGRDVSSRGLNLPQHPPSSLSSREGPQIRPYSLWLLGPRPGLVEKSSATSRRRCGKQPGTHVVLCYM